MVFIDRPIEIPTLIHQVWLGNKDPAPHCKKWMHSVIVNHPKWDYHIWTDEAIERLVKKVDRSIQNTYRTLPLRILKVDMAKYLILKHFGGVYIDVDFELFRDLTPLFHGKSLAFLWLEPPSRTRQFEMSVISNAWMASIPNYALWDSILRHIHNYVPSSEVNKNDNVLNWTGPMALTKVVNSLRLDGLKILPPEIFYPLEIPGKGPSELYGIHYFEGSWWRK